MTLVAPGNQQQCELPLTSQKKRGDLRCWRELTPQTLREESGTLRLALKIVDSAIPTAEAINQNPPVSRFHKELCPPQALRRVKQLPIIVLEVNVKFTSLQLQQLLVQLKSWGTDSRLA